MLLTRVLKEPKRNRRGTAEEPLARTLSPKTIVRWPSFGIQEIFPPLARASHSLLLSSIIIISSRASHSFKSSSLRRLEMPPTSQAAIDNKNRKRREKNAAKKAAKERKAARRIEKRELDRMAAANEGLVVPLAVSIKSYRRVSVLFVVRRALSAVVVIRLRKRIGPCLVSDWSVSRVVWFLLLARC